MGFELNIELIESLWLITTTNYNTLTNPHTTNNYSTLPKFSRCALSSRVIA